MQEAAQRAENERHLVVLRKSNPAAYLLELKKANDPRWESEFKKLDIVGYEKFLKERKAKEEQEKKIAIANYQEKLRAAPASDAKQLLDIYDHLAQLEPSNRNYKAKRDALYRRVEADRYPLAYVTIENFSWSKGGFDNVMIANFTIKNALPWAIKDITIRCMGSAPSGTTIDQNTRTIYQRIESNKTKRIPNFNMGFILSQASRSRCNIVSFVSIR